MVITLIPETINLYLPREECFSDKIDENV